MRQALLLIAIQVALLATSVSAAQTAKDDAKVVVKEVHFQGNLGLPVTTLQDYTEYLIGHPTDQGRLLKTAQFAVGQGLQHRGYLKEQVTAQIHSLKRQANSKDTQVALELTVNAGRQYRIKEMTFSGLSNKLQEAELTGAFDVHKGDIADKEKISAGITNLQIRFHRNGKDVAVIPLVNFDDAASTVSFQFDVQY